MKPSPTTLSIDALGGAVILLIAGAVYLGGVRPSVQAAEAADRERALLAERRAEVDRLEGSVSGARARLKKYSAELTPDQEAPRSQLDRISRISELAALAGVSLIELSPKPEQRGSRFNQVPLTLKGTGASPGFITLLSSLHREFPDTQVVRLTITAVPRERQAPQTFSADLVWYTLANPDAGAGPAGRPGAPAAGSAPAP